MYRELDDNELIYMIRENDDNYEIMQEKYEPYLLTICNEYKKIAKQIGYEIEDLIQIANLGLIDAIRNYKDNQNVLFKTFLATCVKNKLINEIRKNTSNKRIILNSAISYDELIEGTDMTIFDTLKDKEVIDPLDYLLIEERQNEYINFLNSLPFEVAVIYELKVNGFSYEQIARFLEIDKKVIIKSLALAKVSKREYGYV